MISNDPERDGRKDGFGGFVRRHRALITYSILAIVLLPLVGPSIARQLMRLGAGTEENEPADFLRKRADWFFRPRASAHGHIPNALRLAAIAKRDARIRQEGTFADHAARAAGVISTTQWTPIGPQPLQNEAPFGTTSGRVNALAVDPCDSTNNTVYVGAADGGVWRTTNGGTNWTALTDAQPSLSSGSIALVPSGTNCSATTVYFGTGEENFAGDSLYGAGVLKSTNAGSTWTPDVTFNPGQPQDEFAAAPYIGSISVKPGNNSVLLAGLEGTGTITSGIWLSTDGGVHWTLHNPTSPSLDFATGIAFDANDSTGNTAFAAMGFYAGDSLLVSGGACTASPCNGVFKSTNGGTSWSRLTGLDTAINTALGANSAKKYGRITIAVNSGASGPAQTEIIAAIANGTTTSSTFLAAAKSTDGGTTWTVLSNFPAFCNYQGGGGQCFYDMALAIDPSNPNIIFAGGAANAISTSTNPEPTLIRSLDGGTSWADISSDNAGHPNFPQIHVDHHAIVISADGTKVYVGNDGGVWSSTDAMTATAGMQHWANLNNSLQTIQFYPGMSTHPSDPNVVFGGTQDNGSMIYSGTLNWTWTPTCGDGGWSAIGPVSGGTFTGYIVCDAVGNGGTIWRTTNGGGSFIPADSGINFNQAVAFIPPFVQDPTTPQNIYFGSSRLWQSKNQGNTWTAMASGADLTTGGGDVLTTMAVAPGDSNTIYAGSAGAGLRVTTNGLNGASATFSSIATGLPGRSITHLAVDPAAAATAYVAFSGFSGFGDANGHIFKTVNTGASWNTIDGDLPNVPVNDLILDPEAPENTIYAGTDVGVFVTSNGGAHWSTLAPGLPNAEVLSLSLQASNRLLLAGTHGRGAWEFGLPTIGNPTPSISSLDPPSVAAGSAQFTLTVNGANFSANCVVKFSGTELTTDTSGQPTTLTATVPAADVMTAGTFPIAVTDTSTGKTSSSVNFSVISTASNITSISPASATAGAAQFTLTVNGANFSNTSVVNFGGTALTTDTTGQPTSLMATVTLALVANVGTFPVNVTDGGQTSNNVNFTVNPAPDFKFGTITSSPSNATVAAGGSVTYTIPVTAIGGFSSSVALTCTMGLPAKSSCSAASATPGTPASLIISTQANSLVPVSPPANRNPAIPLMMGIALCLSLALAMMLLARPDVRARRFVFGFSFAAVVLLFTLVGCGGGGGGAGGGGGSGGNTGTPAGSYTVTITGTSGSLTHTTTVSLVVSP